MFALYFRRICFHQVKINYRNTTKWRPPGLVPQLRIFLTRKVGPLPPVLPSLPIGSDLLQHSVGLTNLKRMITELMFEAIRTECIGLLRTQRIHPCEARVLAQLYPGDVDGVSNMSTQVQTRTTIY